MLDTPDAPALVSHFLADAHLDGMLPLVQLDAFDASFAAHPAAAAILRQARSRLAGRVPTGGSQEEPAARGELRGVVEEYLS